MKWTHEFRKQWQREYRKRRKDYFRKYRIENAEKRRLYNLEWRSKNREAFNRNQQERRHKRKLLGLKNHGSKSEATKLKEKLRRKQPKYKAWQKEYQQRRIDLVRKNRRNSNARNRATINAYRREKTRMDPVFKIAMNCRSRIGTFFRGNGLVKDRKAMELLGVPNWDFLKHHLESQFKEGMTWDNHSFYGWHIDHIIPLAHFDLRDNTQLMKAFHYTNLQPLWATPNWIKGGRGKIKAGAI